MSPTIYLAAILGFLISLVVMRINDGEWDFYSWDEILPSGTLIGFLVGVAIWFLIGAHNQPKQIEYQKDSRGLVLLRDGQSGVSGNFFLGSGSFRGNMMYYGYEDLGDNKYRMVKFPTDGTIIIEDVEEGESPRFIEVREHANPNVDAWKYDKWMLGPLESDNFVRWEIHIPEGSILKGNYELDAE